MTAVLLFWEEGIKETVNPSPSLKILIRGVCETVAMRIFKMNVVMILIRVLTLGFTLKFS